VSYSTVAAHQSMALDQVRNDAYARAIRRRVTSGSVVLDLGAGLGVHGLLAALAGARRVYMVEPEPVISVAREIANAHEFGDRIVTLMGNIEDVELPEPVDLIISVFTGDVLFSEDLLPSLFHARDKHLKPGGHLIPDAAELVLVPISSEQFHAKEIAIWSQPHLGLNFSAARPRAANGLYWQRRGQYAMQQLAEPVAITRIDLTQASKASCQGHAEYAIGVSGDCHGLLAWIRINLDGEWLTTEPDAPAVHWSPVILPLDPPLHLSAGDSVSVQLDRPEHGDWTWTVDTPAGRQRHSTFLERPWTIEQLRALSPEHQPTLGADGEAALLALTLMERHVSNIETARELRRRHAARFAGEEAALAFVRKLVARYGR
jgi:hypothetical protein